MDGNRRDAEVRNNAVILFNRIISSTSKHRQLIISTLLYLAMYLHSINLSTPTTLFHACRTPFARGRCFALIYDFCSAKTVRVTIVLCSVARLSYSERCQQRTIESMNETGTKTRCPITSTTSRIVRWVSDLHTP